MLVRNISTGPRGIWTTGGLVTLEAGEVRDIDLAEGEDPGEWFEFEEAGKNPARPAKGSRKPAGAVDQPESDVDAD